MVTHVHCCYKERRKQSRSCSTKRNSQQGRWGRDPQRSIPTATNRRSPSWWCWESLHW